MQNYPYLSCVNRCGCKLLFCLIVGIAFGRPQTSKGITQFNSDFIN